MPQRGHWNKLRAGHKVVTPSFEGEDSEVYIQGSAASRLSDKALSAKERAKTANIKIAVDETLSDLPPLVGELKQVLDKRKPNKDGRVVGGQRFSMGHLYQILKNQTYIGRVVHKGESYEGMQEAIIDDETWEAVQDQLKNNATDRLSGKNVKSPSLLTGLLYDEKGRRLTTSQTKSKGKILRYYIGVKDEDGNSQSDWRLPAKEVENVVEIALKGFLQNGLGLIKKLNISNLKPQQMEGLIIEGQLLLDQISIRSFDEKRKLILSIISRVTLATDNVCLIISRAGLCKALGISEVGDVDGQTVMIDVPVQIRKRGVEKKIVLQSKDCTQSYPDEKLIKTISQALLWFGQLVSGQFKTVREIASANNTDDENVTRTLRLAFLAPNIVETILKGRQPLGTTAFQLKRLSGLSLNWKEQESTLCFLK